MTMHLDKRLSTISARKRKSMPVTINTKLVKDFREHNKLMKRCRLPEKTIEQYIAYIQGKAKVTTRKGLNKIPTYTSNHRELYPSEGALVGHMPAKPTKKYNGERKLLGIAVMHKSNLQPVWSKEQAEDISKMRRG